LVEQAEDAISDAKLSFWYIGGRRTRCLIVSQNLYLPQQKFIVQINTLRQECIASIYHIPQVYTKNGEF